MAGKTPYLRELGEFLRARRNELTPADVGLDAHGSGRRRVEGLRREEVATLVAISPDYYMRIEQGRMAPSPSVLSAIARALHLDADQTRYVGGLLAQGGAPPHPSERTTPPKVHPHLARLLDQLDGFPGMVLGPRLHILGWNPLAAALYIDFGTLPESERNYVRLVFTHPAMRAVYADWADVGRRAVEFLRMEAAENPGDPVLIELVDELSKSDQQFREWWAAHRVAQSDFGTKVLCHPVVGEMTLDWSTLRFGGAPEQHLVIWSAPTGSPSYELLQRLARLV